MRDKLGQSDSGSPVWEHNFRGRLDADDLATCEIVTDDEIECCGRGRCWRDARCCCCHSDGSGGGHSSERARNRCGVCRSRKPPKISSDGLVWLPLGLIYIREARLKQIRSSEMTSASMTSASMTSA